MKDALSFIIESFSHPFIRFRMESNFIQDRMDESKSEIYIWAEIEDEIEFGSKEDLIPDGDLYLYFNLRERIKSCMATQGYSIHYQDEFKIIGAKGGGDIAHIHFSDNSIHLYLFDSGQN